MAHEELGAGSWVGAAESVPTTKNKELLATLDVSDETHPRLAYKPIRQNEEKPTNSDVEQQSLSSKVASVEIAEPFHQSGMQSDRGFLSSPNSNSCSRPSNMQHEETVPQTQTDLSSFRRTDAPPDLSMTGNRNQSIQEHNAAMAPSRRVDSTSRLSGTSSVYPNDG